MTSTRFLSVVIRDSFNVSVESDVTKSAYVRRVRRAARANTIAGVLREEHPLAA